MTDLPGKQLLHLVFGGELTSLDSIDFRIFRSWTSSGSTRTTPAPMRPGRPRRRERGQRAYALLHRASPSPAGSAAGLIVAGDESRQTHHAHRPVQEALGGIVAGYLKLVRRTNRFVMEPADAYDRIGPMMPVIAAMWHGQHFMIHFAKRPEDRGGEPRVPLGRWRVQRHRPAPSRRRAIRGSARAVATSARKAAAAMRAMMRALSDGEMVVMTADIPKISRVCGEGIVTLAQLWDGRSCPSQW